MLTGWLTANIHSVMLDIHSTSLAASTTAYWILAGCTGLQGTVWLVSDVPGEWLPACHYDQPPTTSIVQRRYVRGSKNSHKSRQSIFHCCWTVTLKQLTSPHVWF